MPDRLRPGGSEVADRWQRLFPEILRRLWRCSTPALARFLPTVRRPIAPPCAGLTFHRRAQPRPDRSDDPAPPLRHRGQRWRRLGADAGTASRCGSGGLWASEMLGVCASAFLASSFASLASPPGLPLEESSVFGGSAASTRGGTCRYLSLPAWCWWRLALGRGSGLRSASEWASG
jgi:hypothetical protein